ncbi:hypothetical protein MRX96_019023 [Rhipicephalus microplus]
MSAAARGGRGARVSLWCRSSGTVDAGAVSLPLCLAESLREAPFHVVVKRASCQMCPRGREGGGGGGFTCSVLEPRHVLTFKPSSVSLCSLDGQERSRGYFDGGVVAAVRSTGFLCFGQALSRLPQSCLANSVKSRACVPLLPLKFPLEVVLAAMLAA